MYVIDHAKVGLLRREPSAGNKYKKCIYQYDFENDSCCFRWRSGPARDVIPQCHHYVAHWVFPHDEPMPGVGHPPHAHKTTRPWIFMEVNQGPKHTDPLCERMVFSEELKSDPAQGFFRDEGFEDVTPPLG